MNKDKVEMIYLLMWLTMGGVLSLPATSRSVSSSSASSIQTSPPSIPLPSQCHSSRSAFQGNSLSLCDPRETIQNVRLFPGTSLTEVVRFEPIMFPVFECSGACDQHPSRDHGWYLPVCEPLQIERVNVSVTLIKNNGEENCTAWGYVTNHTACTCSPTNRDAYHPLEEHACQLAWEGQLLGSGQNPFSLVAQCLAHRTNKFLAHFWSKP